LEVVGERAFLLIEMSLDHFEVSFPQSKEVSFFQFSTLYFITPAMIVQAHERKTIKNSGGEVPEI
jgi:hypothetical protein